MHTMPIRKTICKAGNHYNNHKEQDQLEVVVSVPSSSSIDSMDMEEVPRFTTIATTTITTVAAANLYTQSVFFTIAQARLKGCTPLTSLKVKINPIGTLGIFWSGDKEEPEAFSVIDEAITFAGDKNETLFDLLYVLIHPRYPRG